MFILGFQGYPRLPALNTSGNVCERFRTRYMAGPPFRFPRANHPRVCLSFWPGALEESPRKWVTDIYSQYLAQ